MDAKTYYEILEVEPTASPEEIKESRHILRAAWHPDKFKGNSKSRAEEKFKDIEQAYDVLGNPQKRAEYDRLLAQQHSAATNQQQQQEEQRQREKREQAAEEQRRREGQEEEKRRRREEERLRQENKQQEEIEKRKQKVKRLTIAGVLLIIGIGIAVAVSMAPSHSLSSSSNQAESPENQPSGGTNKPFTIELTTHGVLLAGGWQTENELSHMSAEDKRNALIAELNAHTNQPISHFQGFNDDVLVGKGAILVFLREAGVRDDSALKNMSDEDQRNTLIVENSKHTGKPISQLQAMNDQDLVKLGLEWFTR